MLYSTIFSCSLITSLLNRTAAACSILSLVLVCFLPAQLAAQPLDLSLIALKLQNTYEKATSLVADFNQTTSMRFSRRERYGSGSMIFLKPGRMRWDYILPEHQILISDGNTISMYFEKSNQMIISDAREYLQSDVTYSFFAGTGDILKDFDVVDPDFENMQENSYLIKLVPKAAHPHVAYIHAWITAETYLLQHLQIVDHFDTITDLFFENFQIDSGSYGGREITKNLFSYTPPSNTEIIKQY